MELLSLILAITICIALYYKVEYNRSFRKFEKLYHEYSTLSDAQTLQSIELSKTLDSLNLERERHSSTINEKDRLRVANHDLRKKLEDVEIAFQNTKKQLNNSYFREGKRFVRHTSVLESSTHGYEEKIS